MNHKHFVHLNVHSEYSIVDGMVRLSALCEKVNEYHQPAVAVTDVCNLFATVKFFKKAAQKGIQPIIGAELWIEPQVEPHPYAKVLLLCQNKEGYKNLVELITLCYQEGKRDKVPLAKYRWLKNLNAGLIAIACGKSSDFGQLIGQNNSEKAEKCLQAWQSWFGDRFYFGLSRCPRDPAFEQGAFPQLQKMQLPVVALNEVVFLEKNDHEAHEARVCIQEGVILAQTNRVTYHPEQYLQSTEAMCERFEDIPSALENTVQIAKRCAFFLELGDPALPNFPIPEGQTEESYIHQESLMGLEKRLNYKFKLGSFTEEQKITLKQKYQSRLEEEIRVIQNMGFLGYFLIVADFIQWAKSHDIPVGPGRGSGAGSLVAYALSITDIDPLDYDLLFERFLNPERVSMPDFDVDFCMDNRDRVIEYVAQRYGRDCVSQIATFGTMAAKAVVRDVGRVLGHPYGFVDSIAKLIPFEIGMTLEKALSVEPLLAQRYEAEEEVKILIDLARKLEGITRNVGKHAGGVVIAPSKLSDFTPLYCEENSPQTVTQFDKDDAETVGLVKFDFLGLRTLTIIHWAVQNANALLKPLGKALIEINHILMDDPKTFQLLKRCDTTAVFQLESHGMKELIKRLRPDHFEEIIALVALFRPGPLQSGMVDDFINRKHGLADVVYAHEKIAPILKPTYGVILYQEQVMQIAQVLAGYTLGQADLLRRAMGKKKPEEMAKQREAFVSGAVERGVAQQTAESIFDLMEKFAGYGFNKSHSAAYALVAYQTAWLKAHFPACYMAAVLSADLNHTDKIVKFVEACKQSKIKIIPPDINQSEHHFTVGKGKTIHYGLGAIKGAGEGAILNIIESRNDIPYQNLFEFCERVDLRKVTRRVLEPLIKAGAFDCFKEDRGVLIANLSDAIKEAEQSKKDQKIGQGDLFAQQESTADPHYKKESRMIWPLGERLRFEKESLGLYFSGHPIDAVADKLKAIGVYKIKSILDKTSPGKFMIAGLITQIRTMQTKKGDRMAFVTLDDQSAQAEIVVFTQMYQNHRDVLIKDSLVVMEVQSNYDKVRQSQRIRATAVSALDQAQAKKAKALKIKGKEHHFESRTIESLKKVLKSQPKGECPIYIEYDKNNAQAVLKLNSEWHIEFTVSTLEALKSSLPEEVEVEVLY